MEGAVRALGRKGLRRMSMTDVGEEAGISRGTLYRYFTSREQLLFALERHLVQKFEDGLERAIADRPDLDVRVRVVVDWLAEYSFDPHVHRLSELQPGLVLGYLRRSQGRLRGAVARALDPAIERAAIVQERNLDVSLIGEMFERAMIASYLVARTDPREFAARLAELWEAISAPSARPAPRDPGTARDQR